ncbi:MAG TPA: MdtA/MuxA family multidrug efflux RND transporter periplasmic adaptor subunit [Acidobacteriaceae bacterium]|nr:MdtA/MuxA family multidrug efflux RND transporter periplasmic adaptor subunit [Acidobacteriaceae bacterium]
MKTLELEESPLTGQGPKAGKSSWRAWISLGLLLVVAAIIGWRIYSTQQEDSAAAQKSAASGNRPVPVLAGEVQQKKMPIYLTALGTVEAYNTVTVRSRIDGQLVKVNFKEGQMVRRGTVLAQIDPEPYNAALELAQGQLERDQAAASIGKAQASRYQGLFNAGVVSQESQQTQQSIFDQAQGTVRADQAAIHAAKVNLAYTTITSPIDGQVGLRQVDVGNIIHASDTNGLVVVTQLQPISVIFTVPEDQLPQVRKKLMAGKQLVVEAYDRSMTNKLATGTLLTVDNQIDATTGTDKLKAVFPNKDNALFPNQFVNVRLQLEERPDVLVIPAAAVQMGNSGNFVYVIRKDQTVEVRNIPNGITQGALLLLDSGLKPGERVVTDGQEKIHAGSKVSVGKGAAGGKGGAPAGAAGTSGKAKDGSDADGAGKGKSAHTASSESGAAQ